MQPHIPDRSVLLKPCLPSAEIMAGSVERVDVVQRELTILAGRQRIAVDVPPQCPVMLRGERIKLRIIQPGDVVRIRLVDRAARPVAQRVEIAPLNSLPVAGEN